MASLPIDESSYENVQLLVHGWPAPISPIVSKTFSKEETEAVYDSLKEKHSLSNRKDDPDNFVSISS